MNIAKYYNYIALILLSLASCNKIDLNWDLHKVPEVQTSAVESVLDISAKGGGNIIDDGGVSVLERGVCYSQQNNPTINDKIMKSGSGKGSFTVNLVGLTPKTTYYLRAYATNKVGISYGNETTFTTKGLASLTTNLVSSITLTTAQCGGNITSDGGLTITQRGICFSTSENPTVSNNKILSGTGVGIFTANLSNLTSNTTYYIRAYAINSIGTAYGNQVSFTTASLATLTTNLVTSITLTSAQCGGNITNSGSSSILERGICYSTSANPTISNSKVASGTGTGSFTVSITGLTSNTTYYVRAYATNSAGTAYGNQAVFTTNMVFVPSLTTTLPTLITTTSATSGGNVTSDGGSAVTARGVCYSTNSNPTISNSIVASGTGTGSFTVSITGLTSNTTYYVRAYATNSAGTAYGTQVSFTTSIAYSLGQSYGGGIIFYIDLTGQHGLIAATSNQTNSIWGCSGTTLSGCNGTTVGMGQSNTTAIVNGCSTVSIAARICDDLVLNGYSDWYLPSKDELNLMYLRRNLFSGFSTGYYWSSTQVNSTVALVQSFETGTQVNATKASLYYVRAVRTF